MSGSGKLVAIVGATGVTGGHAFDAAAALGLSPLALGRNRALLIEFLNKRSLPSDRLRIVDLSNSAELRLALTDVAVVISTVAPFRDNGIVVARAAAELGIGYTDPSGEAGFIREVIETLDSIALKSGATLCTGNGASAFLGDIAIRWLVDLDRDRVGRVLYDIRDYTPSGGSLRSYLTSILPAGGARIRGGKIELRSFAIESGSVNGTVGYNSVVPDALVVSRYWEADSFDGLAKAGRIPRRAIRAMSVAVTDTMVARMLLKLPLEKWFANNPRRNDESSVSAHVEVGPGDGTYRRRSVKGAGIYPLTGKILAATAKAMLECEPRPPGVRAASEMFRSFAEASELSSVELISDSSLRADRLA